MTASIVGAGYGWCAVAVLFAVVFLTRNTFILLGERFRPKGMLARAFDYAPMAGLAALVMPDMCAPLLELVSLRTGELSGFMPAASDPESLYRLLQQLLRDGRVPAVLALFAAGFWKRSALHALVAGTLVYAALRFYVFGAP